MIELSELDGKRIKDLGYKPGHWWKDAIKAAEGKLYSNQEAKVFLADYDIKTVTFRELRGPILMNIKGETPAEIDNVVSCVVQAAEIARLPTVEAVALLPDACPMAGQSPWKR